MKMYFCLIISYIVRVAWADRRMPADVDPPPVSYAGAQVWRTPLHSALDIGLFKRFMLNEDISIWDIGKTRVDYLVHDKDRMRVHRNLEFQNLNHTVLVYDVQRRIEASAARLDAWTDHSLRVGHRLNFKSYPDLTIMDEYYDFLLSNFESIVKVQTIGYSVENRTIKMITISNGNPANKKILITAGHHAREWIGITSALYVANNIITKYDQHSDYMKNKDWYIVPVINPDGYYYTQTTDRLWRKNRRKHNNNPKCPGVDLNRNYPKHWQVAGVTTHDTCLEDYAGPFPLSEPETLTLLNLLDSMGSQRPSVYFDLHSYGQLLLFPWAGSAEPSDSRSQLEINAKAMSSTIFNATGKYYKFGVPSEILYVASGAAIDWLHSKGVPLCFAIESRDLGSCGFLLPPDQIEETGKEVLGAIRVVAKNLDPKISVRGGRHEAHRWF